MSRDVEAVHGWPSQHSIAAAGRHHLPKGIGMSIVHHVKAPIHVYSDWFASCTVHVM